MNRLVLLAFATIVVACTPSEKQECEEHQQAEPTIAAQISTADSAKLAEFWKMASVKELGKKSLPETQIAVANWFLGTPYVGKTLEINEEEQLVINLSGLDCTTFLENVTALSLCVNSGKNTASDYFGNLQKIRYKSGQIKGYTSRLHYFTEWLVDNEAKGMISIVSNSFGDEDFDATVNFMSENPQYYKHLADSANLAKVAASEKVVSATKLKLVTQEHLESVEQLVKNGDLIAISTTMNGLDIAHVGIAAHHNGRLHFIHASSTKKKVVLSEKPLAEYLKGIKTSNGVLVARIN